MRPLPVPLARHGGELLTVEQAADRLRMSARYVRRLIAERRIGFYRLGRSVRIDPADLTAFVTAGRIDPITETTVWNDLKGVG
jgi:excisionase family DNA binding protein